MKTLWRMRRQATIQKMTVRIRSPSRGKRKQAHRSG
jgi:hypothetical protein